MWMWLPGLTKLTVKEENKMPDVNIKYQKGMILGKMLVIKSDISSLLIDKAAEYDKILEEFSVSQCDHATQLRNQLILEKNMVNAIADFYEELVLMIGKASNDLDLVEAHYATTHVSGQEE